MIVRLLKLTILSLVTVLSFGCGEPEVNSDRPAPTGVAPTDASGAALTIDPAKLGIKALQEHSNPVVSMNAKRLEGHLTSFNYSESAISLSTISSIRLSPQHTKIVMNIMNEFQRVAGIAAQNGDANAQFALDYLKDLRNP